MARLTRHLAALALIAFLPVLATAFAQEGSPPDPAASAPEKEVTQTPGKDDEHAGPELLHPLRDARPGEWVIYDMGAPMSSRETVIAVDDDEAVIRSEILYEGHPISTTEERIPLDSNVYVDPRHMAAGQLHILEKEIDVGSLSVNAQVLEVRINGQCTRTYLSTIVPVNGLLMITKDGQTIIRALDWGTDFSE